MSLINALSTRSINFRLLVFAASIIILPAICMVAVFPPMAGKLARSLLKQDARCITVLVAENLGHALQAADGDRDEALGLAMAGLQAEAASGTLIRSVNLHDRAGVCIARFGDEESGAAEFPGQVTEPTMIQSGDDLVCLAPVPGEGEVLGHVSVIFAADEVLAGSRRFLLLALVAGLAVMAVGTGMSLIFARSITGPLNEVIQGLARGADSTMSASRMVSESSLSMADGANNQAASLQEIAASLAQITEATKMTATNAKGSNLVAGDALKTVTSGREAMSRMNTTIEEIRNSSQETARIINTISEIAFQTNLLALNAAVEAARAGDAGRGFAVVAEEVRNLAQRSSQAVQDTTNLIEESQRKADNGVQVAEEVAGILDHIVESIGDVSGLIGEVADANNEQAGSVAAISERVIDVDRVTQSNTASAEQSASASAQLSTQATELNDLVGKLVKVVRGKESVTAQS